MSDIYLSIQVGREEASLSHLLILFADGKIHFSLSNCIELRVTTDYIRMDSSQPSALPNEAIPHHEERLYLELLEEGGTPSAIETGTLFFRRLFTSNLSTHRPHPENCTRLDGLLSNVETIPWCRISGCTCRDYTSDVGNIVTVPQACYTLVVGRGGGTLQRLPSGVYSDLSQGQEVFPVQVYSETPNCDPPREFAYISSSDFSSCSEPEDNEGIAMVQCNCTDFVCAEECPSRQMSDQFTKCTIQDKSTREALEDLLRTTNVLKQQPKSTAESFEQ
ncbi:hypothetical protein KIN20_017471 [Parelaphostrongylus tenuis]|uniref:Uncharacterized protein n=1 Tax=Parelaphostrongylus tenuis TaxID=148309 RepID=A0AAD5N6F0_PARTN|nr:hypothetical protein KIN20_017471 [Parelaphostrongylus tenuis]